MVILTSVLGTLYKGLLLWYFQQLLIMKISIITGLLVVGATLPASAQVEPNHVCYMVNAGGGVVNLDSLCAGNSSVPFAGAGEQVFFRVEEPVRAGNGGFEGTVTNSTGKPITSQLVGYTITYNNGVERIEVASGEAYLYAPSGTWADGEGITFGDEFDDVESDAFEKYFTNALELTVFWDESAVRAQLTRDRNLNSQVDRNGNPPGSCQYPWQVASDGSRCGNRAASVRDGGL